MKNYNSDSKTRKQQTQLGIYYLPVIGIIPSLWTLLSNRDDRQQQNASRLSITLTLLWFSSYSLLSVGSDQASELIALRLLYTNALITTGYFLICLGLILRLKQGKHQRLPGISKLADRIITKSD